MTVVTVRPDPETPQRFSSLRELSDIRSCYPRLADWAGWWQNPHTGGVVCVRDESHLNLIGFFSAEHAAWIVENWRKLDGEPALGETPDHALRQLTLFGGRE